MDKTTTWLIRGASITVIFIGFFYFFLPEMRRISEIRSNDDFEYQNSGAERRCKDLVIPSLPIQINTSKGNFLTDIYPSEDREPSLLRMFTDKDIPIKVGGPRMCKYKD